MISDSTCSRSSCSACGEDSEISDEESVVSENNNEDLEDVKKREGKYRKSPAITSRKSDETSTNRSSAGSRSMDREPDKHYKSISAHSFINATSNNLPTTRFNIPKPELKVSSQPRSMRTRPYGDHSQVQEISPPPADHGDIPRMTSPLPIFSKTPSQIELIRDFSNMYSSPVPLNASRSSTSLFPSSFSTDQVDHMATNAAAVVNHEIDYLKYQTQPLEKVQRPMSRMPQQQQHKVIEIVPKPPLRQTSTGEWRAPDQTLGIPVISPSSSMSHLHAMQQQPPIARPMFNYAAMHMSPMPMMPMHGPSQMVFNPKPISLLKSKSMYSIANNPQVIHQHPLVSGHIPPSQHFADSYTLKRNATSANVPAASKIIHRPPNINAPSILSTPSSQPNVLPKKENGEKNKVKFSDTVTVAVVPVCQNANATIYMHIDTQ